MMRGAIRNRPEFDDVVTASEDMSADMPRIRYYRRPDLPQESAGKSEQFNFFFFGSVTRIGSARNRVSKLR